MPDHDWIKEFPAAITVCDAAGIILAMNDWAAHEKSVYTIEKNGARKLIYQSPWYRDGACAGFVELSLGIPWEMPHFIRT